ncbi:hypothetical protein Tco_0923362 [Tanacetum coccineum]|uniref:Uncharacterized protein n=1 Tax=Tanacetum coccineum TaxID=301880 RepID=A0ABQ5D373_9ASTR
MAQQQPQQIISSDLFIPANKRYDLADANKKTDLVNPSSTDNNNDGFVEPFTFTAMLPLFLDELCYAIRIRLAGQINEYYHRIENDEVVRSLFNYGKKKELSRLRIPKWTLTEEMKLTRYCQLYALAFRVEVPMTQS